MLETYITLGISTLIPVIASVALYLIGNKTPAKKLPYWAKQIFIGLIFGGIAILSTEWGAPVYDANSNMIALANVRDAAPVCAGLLFGAPAGIIAGLIGGVERFLAVAWGAAEFTKYSCAIATIVAGFAAAFLRKKMFDNKRPGWAIALAIAFVMEVFHLLLIFILNSTRVVQAATVVEAITVPMLISNSVAVMLSSIFVSLLARDFVWFNKKEIKISQTMQRWLLVVSVFAFAITMLFTIAIQTNVAIAQNKNLLKQGIEDVIYGVEEKISDIESEGISGEEFKEELTYILTTDTHNRHIGTNGFVIIIDENKNVVSAPDDIDASAIDFSDISDKAEGELFYKDYNGEQYCLLYMISDGYYIISGIPNSEAFYSRNLSMYVNSFMEVIVFAIIFVLIFLLVNKVIVRRLQKVNEGLSDITDGNLDTVIDVRTNKEFNELSDGINSTVTSLKDHIAKEAARIDEELEFARNIQTSSLPSIFPKRDEFELFACMYTAKEVGGDFYDFYLTHQNILNFLIADVSGKGIPASLFMMRSKTELKSLTESGMSIDEVFTKGNDALCEGNDAGMFVTAFQGRLDVKTGKIEFVNAGHNAPVIIRADGRIEFLKSRAGFVLAGMEGINYKIQECQLSKGDIIFTYTDGVTEATDASGELYGDDRLLKALGGAISLVEDGAKVQEKSAQTSMKGLCDAVKTDVDSFAKGAPQFDDITMLAIRYNG